jgi:hypothetical protein
MAKVAVAISHGVRPMCVDTWRVQAQRCTTHSRFPIECNSDTICCTGATGICSRASGDDSTSTRWDDVVVRTATAAFATGVAARLLRRYSSGGRKLLERI